ncbi:hypothetical protein ABXJ76_03475 [Methylobacter sp. G7]|uniref:type II secretion system protein n=1 Tax=Methylobacter sp. G7 TaxID=3230117 RepID=UPI003D803B14
MKQPPLTTKQQGFSLFELAIVLTVAAGLGVALFSVTTNHFTQLQQQRNADALAVADRQLLHYAAIHGRLPCPDSTNDGVEDCGGSAKGSLPYLTIGLIAKAYAAGEIPLRYGVYRKADAVLSNDADLAAPDNKNRFEPTSSDNCSYDTNKDNVVVTDSAAPVCPGVTLNNHQDAGLLRHGTLDLCLALKNGSTHAASASYTFTQPPAGADNPVAYALAAAGANGVFDDVNNSSSFGFNSPATPAQTTYDDQTLARSFAEVYQHLRCEVAMQSLHILADTVAVDDEVKAQQQAMKDQAEQAVQDSIMGAISAGLSVALAIAAVVEATELSTAASVALALHTGLCAATLGLNVVSCAAIPLAAAALGSAGTALGLAYAAVALNTAAMAAQIAAAILFDQVAQKAGAAIGAPSPDLIASQQQQLASAVDNRDDSYQGYLTELIAANAARIEANALINQATVAYNTAITTTGDAVRTAIINAANATIASMATITGSSNSTIPGTTVTAAQITAITNANNAIITANNDSIAAYSGIATPNKATITMANNNITAKTAAIAGFINDLSSPTPSVVSTAISNINAANSAITGYAASATAAANADITGANATFTTAKAALDTAISALGSYESAYANWASLQTAADAKKLECSQDTACATTQTTTPYAISYTTSNVKYIAWQSAQTTADNTLTSLNTVKTTTVNQWAAAVQAGKDWDVATYGGNDAATCTSNPAINLIGSASLLYWWPTYTIDPDCTLAGQFQNALMLKQQQLAKEREASRLESSAIQKFSNWKSAAAMVEQTVCGQQKKTYGAAAGGDPSDIRLAVVPEWPTVSPPLILNKIAATAPETGTVPANPATYTRAGSGAAYSWWGSCSDIPGGSGTLISITPGARPILNQADQLGLTQ